MNMEEKIIEFVRGNRFLYDRSDSSYRNQHLKDKKWRELSREVNIPVDSCKKRWKSIRDRFHRVRKNECALIQRPTRKYKYFHLMQFLCNDESPNMRPTDHFPPIEDMEDMDDMEEIEDEKIFPFDDNSCLSATRSSSPPIITGKRTNAEPVETEMLDLLSSINRPGPSTPFRAFLESIALTVENASFNLQQITSLQMNILQLVHDTIQSPKYPG